MAGRPPETAKNRLKSAFSKILSLAHRNSGLCWPEKTRDLSGVLVDYRLTGGDKFVHLVTRQREPSADGEKPRPHFGLVEIGQVDAQHAPGHIIAWVSIYRLRISSVPALSLRKSRSTMRLTHPCGRYPPKAGLRSGGSVDTEHKWLRARSGLAHQ